LIPAHSIPLSIFEPNIQPVANAFSQQGALEPRGPVSDGGFPLLPNISVPEPGNASDEGSIQISESRGQKRKGDEAVAMLSKKRCSKDTESLNVETGMSVSEETAMSGDMKERAGKPTLSGRVPLMPAHLAEGGYQGEKKGVRGRKQPTKKPKSKGYTAKPSSKGATKIPGKKKGNSKQ
jgi:hypothetical protein